MVRSFRHAAVAGAVVLAAAGWAALPVGHGASEKASAATTSPPTVATIVIRQGAAFSGYSTPRVTLARGGTLWVKNRDSMEHTVTASAGAQVFDTLVRPGQRLRVSGVSRLRAGSYGFYCRFHSQTMRGTLVIKGSGGSAPAQQQFLQPLKLPPVLTGDHIRLPIERTGVRVLPNGPLTQMWTYGGSYPGPTIRRTAGQETWVKVVDQLPKIDGSFTLHLHGDHHSAVSDGQPTTHLIGSGQHRTYDYPLKDGGKPERGSTFIYHDHRMGRTGRNVWRGQEGLFIVNDRRERSMPLPKGRYDVPLMISDRSFTKDNQLTNPFAAPQAPPNDATVGSKVLVDGRYAPYFNVDTHRYRLRLVNASNFQSYNFKLSDGRQFTQIGTGDGLLPKPVKRSTIMLGPFERADVIVNFGGEFGKRVVLKSVPRTDNPPAGSVGTPSVSIMQFRVTTQVADHSGVPSTLEAPPALTLPTDIAKTWTIGINPGQNWTIQASPDDQVTLGATQKWKIVNTTEITHFIHLHEEQWRTIRRDGGPPDPWERGVEDTWQLDPGESIVVAAKFTDYTGSFMIHCHMLDHEDDGLMAPFNVVASTAPPNPASLTRGHSASGKHHASGAMAGMPGMQAAVNVANTKPLRPAAAGPATPAQAGTSFLQKFAIRLAALLALGAAVTLVQRRRPRRTA